MTHVAFFELEGWEERMLRDRFPAASFALSFSKDKIGPLELPKESDAEALSIFVNSRVTKEVLARFPRLRCVATRSTGFDHIDRAACAERGVTVVSVPGYGDNTVAEFAFGLILNLTRKLYQGIDRVKETSSFSVNGLRGTDLNGKTLGVIGTGRIGKQVVRIARGFNMNVLAYDPRPDEAFAKENGVTYLPLNQLLGNADIITLHAPLTNETRHLIHRHNIGLIKHGAYLVNTARGGLVETAALVEALQKGILAGAGLDVLEEEGEIKDELNFLGNGHPNEEQLKTLIYDHILMEMPNVLITPHNAFNTNEALGEILEVTIGNIKAFASGSPVNVVK